MKKQYTFMKKQPKPHRPVWLKILQAILFTLTRAKSTRVVTASKKDHFVWSRSKGRLVVRGSTYDTKY